MVNNYKPRTDRATYDGALVARAHEELDKGKSLRHVANDLHIPKTTFIRFRKARENYNNKIKELYFQPRDLGILIRQYRARIQERRSFPVKL